MVQGYASGRTSLTRCIVKFMAPRTSSAASRLCSLEVMKASMMRATSQTLNRSTVMLGQRSSQGDSASRRSRQYTKPKRLRIARPSRMSSGWGRRNRTRGA
jgi:hypothetical protein